MMREQVRIAALQIDQTADKEQNMKKALETLDAVSKKGAKLYASANISSLMVRSQQKTKKA